SSDTSEESVGSHAPRVILFGAIPAIIPDVPVVPADPIVTLEVGTVSVVSPSGVLDLVDYSSSSDSDPSEDSLPPVPDLPLVSPSRSSSHDTLSPLSEFPLAPVVALPGIHRRSMTLVRPVRLSLSVDLTAPILMGRAFRRWMYVPLSTPYLPTTSDSSIGSSSKRSLDSSSPSSRPSRKRCRSPTALDDSGEEHIEVDIVDVEVVADVGFSEGVVAHPEDG
ncbi:hypothetical protein Tco_0101334, partial [Tanacetum coccineum]